MKYLNPLGHIKLSDVWKTVQRVWNYGEISQLWTHQINFEWNRSSLSANCVLEVACVHLIQIHNETILSHIFNFMISFKSQALNIIETVPCIT